jgi:NADPH-dependent 2,4-dienoyl-CoA reductase/sulfur reductase-like enzyme/rhodanese-related sulfurtransferase
MIENVVVIGGVALGTKAACRLKRLLPGTNVVLLDKDDRISYGGCGIPYYVSGDVDDVSALQSTVFHMVRDAEYFRRIKGFTVHTRTEATRIDRAAKVVHAVNADGEAVSFPYDKLVIGTGSRPRHPGIPGQDLANIHSVANLHDAVRIKKTISSGQVERAVIVGGGFIGLEMAEALTEMWGIETTVIELSDQIMPGLLSKPMARFAMTSMAEKGVAFCLEERVLRFEGEGRVERVVTGSRTIDADLVILAVGIVANSEIARDSGLEIGETGGIVVSSRLQTSDPDIYAGGDCAELKHMISGKPLYLPLGSIANRHGRIIGTNIAGGDARIGDPSGAFVVKLFDRSISGAGLTVDTARKAGFDAVGVRMCQMDRAHFYPDKEFVFLELVADRKTRRILGVQGFGPMGDFLVGRINTVSAILKYNPVVHDLSTLEFAYSPPFSAAMDIMNALGNVAENILDGRLESIGLEDFQALWEKDDPDVYFLDCRELSDAEELTAKYPGRWHGIPQGDIKEREGEIPRDKAVILVCNSGMRSYEAQLNLRELGIGNTRSLEGGTKMLNVWGSSV